MLSSDSGDKRFSTAFWTIWLVAMALGVLEFYRPGFLCLEVRDGQLGVLFMLGVASAGGFLLGRMMSMPRFSPLLLIPLLLLLFGSRMRVSEQPDGSLPSGRKVVLFGIDGATWNIIDPMIEAGELPNLARLKREGATGILSSQNPSLSPRVWTTIATGVSPETHGAVGFFSTQSSIKSPRMWEIVEREGGKILLWRWLLTWPPVPSNGFVVPGWLARGPETWPPELSFLSTLVGVSHGDADENGSLVGAVIDSYRTGLRMPTLFKAIRLTLWKHLAAPNPEVYQPHLMAIEAEIFADHFVYLLDRFGPDFSAIVLYGTDKLAHRYWHYFEPEKFHFEPTPEQSELADAIPFAYRVADRALGRVMNTVDDSTTIVVLSDHGTIARSEEKSRLSVRGETLAQIYRSEGVEAFNLAPKIFVRQTGYEMHDVEPPFVPELRNVTVDGNAVFEVERSQEPYWCVEALGDPPLDTEIELNGKRIALGRLLHVPHFSGSHDLDGVLGLWGAGVSEGNAIQADLLDIAPTVLALLGVPLSEQLEGEVLDQAFLPGLSRNLRVTTVTEYGQPKHALADEQELEVDEEVRERLRALGYLQ